MPSNNDDLTNYKASIEAAKNSRSKGGSWYDAYEAAKAVGFSGSPHRIVKMVQDSKKAEQIAARQAAGRTLNYSAAAPGGNLARAVRDEFSSGVRNRGLSYYSHSAVTITGGDIGGVKSTVKGHRLYSVSLKLVRDELRIECNCPYYDDVGPCKHIWATILAADSQRLIQPNPPDKEISLVELDSMESIGGDDRIEPDDDSNDFEDEPDFVASARDDDDEVDEDDDEDQRASHDLKTRAFQPSSQMKPPAWQHLVAVLSQYDKVSPDTTRIPWPVGGELSYVIDKAATMAGKGLHLELYIRQRKLDGDWSVPRLHNISRGQIESMPDPADRQIAAVLLGGDTQSTQGYPGYYGSPYFGGETKSSRFVLKDALRDVLLPQLCRTGRCTFRVNADPPAKLQYDDGPPWEFRLTVRADAKTNDYIVRGSLHRDEIVVELSKPVMLLAGGWAFWPEWVARLNDAQAFQWILLLRQQNEIRIPTLQIADFLATMFRFDHLPKLDLPEELRFEEVAGTPSPRLKVGKSSNPYANNKVRAELSFAYGSEIISSTHEGRGLFQPSERRMLLRDKALEQSAAQRLEQLGFRPSRYANDASPELLAKNLPKVVRTLIAENWHVEADGKLYRRAVAVSLSVASGVDWFELHGNADFGGMTATLPALLAALKKGDNMVQLGDGSFGLLPEEWLNKYATLAGTGTVHKDHVRFKQTQAGLLDALLATQPEVSCDAKFDHIREELRQFESIEPAQPPASFIGELRAYQNDGLGWLNFLRRFGFGGCLADDMGLGKTVQVLALLESRRLLRLKKGAKRPGPTLAVVPRSLIFNWKQEAARFTPELRVLDHTGIARAKEETDHFEDFDLILTTYGTLRRDVVHLKEVEFDYIILDEAQAIKNANTGAAKAARLLNGGHRLCMSGTPIENHLGELWSLFDFLNPGMLGAASVFKLGAAGDRAPDEQTRVLLARALRPFILRRTKAQVAKDLPEKTEQTLYCELDVAQRMQYDQLKNHYRENLLNRIQRDGINKAKIQILEALLRLRQAACHPGLIDKQKISESSAKLEVLMPKLTEVLAEGHKALVFSQFTSLLAIVRDRLDSAKIPYEYLDGQTTDRESPVQRFQNNPDCKLFLISLKAGGLGLNLTAAEYVFLLDPWWNPAVEAQAIDRAHRIGQTRPVFAYRLIARGTVEEKVLELQKTKRDLADAIINADNSLIRTLNREDLELLLG